MRSNLKKSFLTVFLAAAMVVANAQAVLAAPITLEYGDLTVDKVTNPEAGSGEIDGIDGDRLNSYAWAMTERDDYIYIGTNRAFISKQVYNTIDKSAGRLGSMAGNITVEELYEIFNIISYNELPNYVEMTDEEAVPELIKVNPNTGETVSLALPEEFEKIATKEEGCAFRSVVEVNGILYFGSYSTNYVFILRVDQNDKVTIAYMAGGESTEESIQYNSLRANAYYEDKLYFGGTSSDLEVWKNDPDKSSYVPLFIGAMEDDYDPENPTRINFDVLIADYRDFRQFASPNDPQVGNEFYDLIEFEGGFYAIISDSYGFAVYKGHPAADGEAANDYGWHWELIVDGDDPQSPAHGYIAATPYIYKDKLYIGTFSNVGAIAQTGVQVALWAFSAFEGQPIMQLKQALTPLYTLLNTTPSLFEMVDDQLVNIDSVTELLEGKCNVYLWRFMEYNGDLYMSTYDASVMERYILDLSLEGLIKAYLEVVYPDLHYSVNLAESIDVNALSGEESESLQEIIELAKALEDILTDSNVSIEDLDEIMALIEELRAAMEELLGSGNENLELLEKIQELLETLEKVLDSIDEESMQMLSEMHEQVANNAHGFDLLTTSDGENWKMVSDDGFGDMYNWGGRTFVNYNGSLYVGTANPFYGAQLWKLTDPNYVEPEEPVDPTPVDPTPEEPTPVDPTPEEPETPSQPSTPETGDSANLLVWISAFALSCCALLLSLYKRKESM